VKGKLPEEAARAEVVRVLEKAKALETAARARGMSLGMVHAAWQKARELFFDPHGEFAWLVPSLRLVDRDGSLLFVHAGVDDTLAEWMVGEGIEGVNQRFCAQLFRDPSGLLRGPLGNALETRYKRADRPLTAQGAALLRCAGIQAVVHGHRNVPHGQRLRVRAGLLHLQCAVPVDTCTRQEKGLPGTGGAVTTMLPEGRVVALSTDLLHAKVLEGGCLAELLAVA